MVQDQAVPERLQLAVLLLKMIILLKKMNEEKTQPIVHELRCKTCGKVCGTITFPADADIDTKDLSQSHETLCDEHLNKKSNE